jgi:2-amino-4-hydroxy-6-hydroxymethyldihydropteridine diphosphokinase
MRIKYAIDAVNSYISTPLFPIVFKTQPLHGRHRVLLGIGGNVGDSVRRFEHLIHYIRRSSFMVIIETSPIIKNPPFGYISQPYFYNAIISISTKLTPHELLRHIHNIERLFGRKRSFKDAPRTLDIDIIMYENRKIDTQKLKVPHISWFERDSVVIPLKYMKGLR